MLIRLSSYRLQKIGYPKRDPTWLGGCLARHCWSKQRIRQSQIFSSIYYYYVCRLKCCYQYPLLPKNSGSITSIYDTVDSKSLQAALPTLHIPLLVRLTLDIQAGWKWLHAWWYGIYWQGTLQITNGLDLQKVAGWVDEGKLNPIIGRTVKLEDIKAVREACVQMSSASRSIGKTVIEII